MFHFLLANSDSPKEIAETIFNIVTEFFGCLHCVENFRKEIEEYPFDHLEDKKSGVLWLWRLHNSGLNVMAAPKFVTF